MSNPETIIQAQIGLAVGLHPDVRLFRNSVGVGYVGKPRWLGGAVFIEHPSVVTFGLAPGSADFIGWRSLTVTPEMVGQRIAIFAAPEVKTATGAARKLQESFLHAVRSAGGIAGIVRSPEEAKRLLAIETV